MVVVVMVVVEVASSPGPMDETWVVGCPVDTTAETYSAKFTSY